MVSEEILASRRMKLPSTLAGIWPGRRESFSVRPGNERTDGGLDLQLLRSFPSLALLRQQPPPQLRLRQLLPPPLQVLLLTASLFNLHHPLRRRLQRLLSLRHLNLSPPRSHKRALPPLQAPPQSRNLQTPSCHSPNPASHLRANRRTYQRARLATPFAQASGRGSRLPRCARTSWSA